LHESSSSFCFFVSNPFSFSSPPSSMHTIRFVLTWHFFIWIVCFAMLGIGWCEWHSSRCSFYSTSENLILFVATLL
jgi:hypothetical protein